MPQRKVFFTGRDYCQDRDASVSGGSWTNLDYIFNIRPQLVAQATDLEPESTQFTVDLGSSRLVGVLFFARLMASKSGQLTVTCSENLDLSSPTFTFDGTCWPKDNTELSIDHWGNFTIDGLYREETFAGLNYSRFLVPTAPVLMRYIKVEINDTTADNKLLLGCFGACEIYEPSHDLGSDWHLDFDDLSEIGTTPFGGVFPTERYMQKTLSVGLQKLPEAEFMSQTLDIVLMRGRHKPIVVLPFTDGEFQEKAGIYGLISSTPSLGNPFFGLYDMTIQVKELV